MSKEIVTQSQTKQKDQSQKELRTRLSHLNECSIEWHSEQSTEVVGEGSMKMSLNELTEHSLEILAKGDGLDWIASYIQGHWNSSDLLQFIKQMVKQDELKLKSTSLWRRSVFQLYKHWMHQSATQAFDFLKVHHDLSDRFFEVFLDQHYLLYGTALYLHPQASLDQAAQSQLQRVCEKLSVIPTDHLFDAGSGWGGLGLYAAKYYGAKVTILSQSLQHQKFIQAKAYLMNVQHLVTLIDRETLIKETHSFNKIALLTPMNLIGHLYAKELIEQLSKTLEPRGLMLIQTLTQSDEGFGALIESFMQRYFFDSYTLYSLPMFFQKAVNHSGLKLLHLETMDEHVARTFIDWYQHLQDNRNRLVDTGLTPTFLRLYDAYIALFYAGACTRKLQGTQILLAKNNYQGNDWLLSHAKSGYFPSPLINNH